MVVRKTVAFGMSVGEITQALQFRDRRGRRTLHYAMPSTALHGLDVVGPFIDEYGPRRLEVEALFRLPIDFRVRFHGARMGGRQHIVGNFSDAESLIQVRPVQVAHIGQQKDTDNPRGALLTLPSAK